MAESLAPARTAVLATTISVVILSVCLWRLAPRWLSRAHLAFKSRRAVASILVFAVVGHYGSNRWVSYPPAAVSPAWALLLSVFQDMKPVVADSIPPEYLADFQPVANIGRVAGDIPVDGAIGRTSRRPRNVLIVVMESIGAKRLELYGAPFDDSPNLMRLARHGALFEHVYGEAITSSAMAGGNLNQTTASTYNFPTAEPYLRYRPTALILRPAILWAIKLVPPPADGYGPLTIDAFAATDLTNQLVFDIPAGSWNYHNDAFLIPNVVNGKVYVASGGELDVFGVSSLKPANGAIGVSPPRLNFGKVAFGLSKAKAFRIKDAGKGDCTSRLER